MTRYQWPAPPRRSDDAGLRGAFLRQLRPAAGVPTADPPTEPPGGAAAASHFAPHVAPAGDQDLWFPIGPSVMQHGQAGGTPNVSGRIRDLAVEPAHGLRAYAASAGGGVWFTADRGVSWRPLDDWQVTRDRNTLGTVATALACGAVYAIWGASADGSDDVVWVGTGEAALTDNGTLAAGSAEPYAPQLGWEVSGIGLLNRDPAVAGGAWTVVKGDAASGDPDTLRGAAFHHLAGDPAHRDQIVAATTRGLYVKATGVASWVRVAAFATSVARQPLDVVLTRLTGPDRLRVWVASGSAVSVAEVAGAVIDPTTLTFAPVAVPGLVGTPASPGTCVQLATDGTSVYVLGRTAVPPKAKFPDPPAVVCRIDATAPLAGLTGVTLSGAPAELFRSTGDQSNYDMCIEAHPSVPGLIYLGGAAAKTSTDWNGAIYRWQTTNTAVEPTLIGEGTHPDVHVLRVGGPAPGDATKHSVWTGTDGGVFRSDADGDAGTFTAANNGLAVLQPGFVACHPTNPGIVVAGFQDNGTAVRIGDGLWRQTFPGDGGGVVFDPASTNRYLRQYAQASWESSDGGGAAPVERHRARTVGTQKTSEQLEAESSLFYSGADAVVHGGDTHLVLGSDRVWYSRDWGRSWMTIPTGTDPRGGDNANVRQDVLDPIAGDIPYADQLGSTNCCAPSTGSGVRGRGIITVRLSPAPGGADGGLVLRVLALYSGGLVWLTGTRAATATGAFAWSPTTGVARQRIVDPSTAAEETILAAGGTLPFLPAPGIVSDVYVHDPARGTLGSCYVTTTGFPHPPAAGGAAVPRDTLWFFDGTDTWIPTGLSTNFPGGHGTWTVPADRITAPALAVIVDPTDRATVYVGTSVGVVRGRLTIGGTAVVPTYAWTWTQLTNGLPEAVVQDLAIFHGSGVTLLRAALQSRGVWELDLGGSTVHPLSYLRLFRTDTRRVLPTPTGGGLLAGDAGPVRWDASPDVVVDPGATLSAPSEVELATLADLPSSDVARVAPDAAAFRVHVLAHHRVGDQSVPAAQVRVALLRHALPDDGVVPLGGVWPALVAAAAAPAPPASLPDGWSAAASTLWQTPSAAVDPRMPRAVSFNVNVADASGSAVVLLAVIMAASNPLGAADLAPGGAAAATTAEQLVLASPHVAALSVAVP